MGRRGPPPSSGSTFRGREVVLRGTAPSIRVEPTAREAPIADRRGYVSIHRLVASEALGRWVTRAEAVTPIDGDPWNCDPRNLRVRPLAASLPPARRGPKVSRSPKPGSRQPGTARPKAARAKRPGP